MNEYDDAMPAYEQVKRFITDHIQSGKWEAGRRVPSEIELVEQHRSALAATWSDAPAVARFSAAAAGRHPRR